MKKFKIPLFLKMILEDSEDEEFELIIKFITSKTVTFDESKNKVYFISDQAYLIKQPTLTEKLKDLFSQKQ